MSADTGVFSGPNTAWTIHTFARTELKCFELLSISNMNFYDDDSPAEDQSSGTYSLYI